MSRKTSWPWVSCICATDEHAQVKKSAGRLQADRGSSRNAGGPKCPCIHTAPANQRSQNPRCAAAPAHLLGVHDFVAPPHLEAVLQAKLGYMGSLMLHIVHVVHTTSSMLASCFKITCPSGYRLPGRTGAAAQSRAPQSVAGRGGSPAGKGCRVQQETQC